MIKALKLLIISLAAPIGIMKLMLYSDWLPELERWALRWLVLFFPFLWDRDLVAVHKNTRKKRIRPISSNRNLTLGQLHVYVREVHTILTGASSEIISGSISFSSEGTNLNGVGGEFLQIIKNNPVEKRFYLHFLHCAIKRNFMEMNLESPYDAIFKPRRDWTPFNKQTGGAWSRVCDV